MKSNLKNMLTKRLGIIVLAVVLVVAIIIICGSQMRERKPFLGNRKSFEIIHSEYVDWSVPADCMEFLKYETETNNNVVADMFYMQVGSAEIPIFRFDFGDENAGDWLGLLTVGEEKIPVVYTVFMVSDEELAAVEGAEEAYYMLMDVFNEMVQDLTANKNFTQEKPIKMSGNEQEAVLTYWTVTLPTEMSYYETNENGTYQAFFYGYIQDEKIALYQVNIGDIIGDSPLGLYKIENEDKTVSITCHDIFDRADWSEDDYAVAYRMMDTINNVIEKITSSEYFSEFEPVE